MWIFLAILAGAVLAAYGIFVWIELVRRDVLDAVAVPNKTSLVNQPDNDPGDTGHARSLRRRARTGCSRSYQIRSLGSA